MYAHAFTAKASDRKLGYRFEVTLTTGGDLSKPEQRVLTVLATDKRDARRIAKLHNATPHNF